ncbi:hypothetical protein GCM10011575_35540 [Microlunatus endophyticus]|uniref:DUF1206 domain-containing protein n=1 Tax=Microlunatus endophyticus TaxID=1716077 RepID=A0A917SFT0_9ACTN|nr:DUF1206 domain-containing protein [Microlunatus endophyticus]GGL74204.1 hypothetical protein GCM10011575_35540 [Microlunatus endophyticus]
MDASAHQAARKVDRATAEAGHSQAVAVLVAVGLIAYGIVHLTIAWVALQVAWGSASNSASQQGAIAELASTPVGPLLLWVLAVGFFALLLWRLMLAARGFSWLPRRRRTRKRIGSLGQAVVYGYLGVTSLKFAIGTGSSSSRSKTITGQLMDNTAGRILLVVVAAGVVAVGIGLIVKGIRASFTTELEGGGRALVRLGQIGYIAKGIAFLIVGCLLALATIRHHPGQAGGLDAAVHAIKNQPYGPVLLTVLAAGIACFGVYCFGWARRARTS